MFRKTLSEQVFFNTFFELATDPKKFANISELGLPQMLCSLVCLDIHLKLSKHFNGVMIILRTNRICAIKMWCYKFEILPPVSK